MNYQISLFKNTGFNSINIPDRPALVDSCPQITLSSDDAECDILQAKGLVSLALRVPYSDAEQVDYMRLYDASTGEKVYYVVNGFSMTSPDVCTFSLTLDPITTMGGITELHFLDGVTERHHCRTADDTFGAFTEDDPMVVPSKELKIVGGTQHWPMRPYEDGDPYLLVESMDDLSDISNTPKGISYDAVNSPGKTCEVPTPSGLDFSSARNTEIDVSDGMGHTGRTLSPGTAYFDRNDATIYEGLKRARGLGVEGSIVNSWILPHNAGLPTVTSDGLVSTLVGVDDEDVCNEHAGLAFDYTTSVHNMRCMYGKYNSYTLYAVGSGNSIDFKPEDIYDGNQYPTLRCITDPRPSGKPFFRFKTYKGEINNFFCNCLSGQIWANAPIIYYDKSGNEIDQMRYETSQSIEIASLNRSLNAMSAERMIDIGTGAYNAVMGSDIQSAAIGATSPTLYQRQAVTDRWKAAGYSNLKDAYAGQQAARLGLGRNLADYGVEQAGKTIAYGIQRDMLRNNAIDTMSQETQEFRISQQIVTPTLTFPRNDTLRDFLGNGVVLYKLRPDDADLVKMDKLYTMYGYYDHRPMDNAFLTNRSKFNYISVKGASLGGTKPKWLRELAATVLSVGVRIWHVTPDITAYTDGSNV
jgi:hypothetical protein